MSTQHTKGPWFVSGMDIKSASDPAHYRLAEVHGGRPGYEREANAHLIAAAPDLLAELQKVREIIADWNQSFIETVINPKTGLIDDPEDVLTAEADQDLLNGIDAAIAKATGAV